MHNANAFYHWNLILISLIYVSFQKLPQYELRRKNMLVNLKISLDEKCYIAVEKKIMYY